MYTAAGIVFGGIISALVAYVSFRSSSRQLRSEAEKLRRETTDVRHYVDALITYLQAAGSIRVTRGEDGRPLKVQFIGPPAFIESKAEVFEPRGIEQDDPTRADQDREKTP